MSSIEHLEKYVGTHFTENPSAFGRWLNPVVVEVTQDKITVEFTVRENMTNAAGMLHGGIIAGIADEMMGMHAMLGIHEGFFVSVSLQVNYLYGAKQGEVLRVESCLLRRGKTIAHVECLIKNADGIVVAKATSSLARTNMSVQKIII
ncbi:MAG: PaaI family thioesterase [Cytophagaceae bacterium]|nr:PaaI family thioesterase [Cytophagaceae bacterium]MDW8455152.1 PaaI family thioesterase [Cytophagaceae bacterium]